MIKELTKIVSIIFLVITAVACGGPDTSAPTVTITKPSSNQKFEKGESISLDAYFKDNKELSKCTVSLAYKDADTKSANTLMGISEPYAPEEAVITLSGSSVRKDLKNIFTTPIDAICKSGNYTLTFIVEDKAGNTKNETVVIAIQ